MALSAAPLLLLGLLAPALVLAAPPQPPPVTRNTPPQHRDPRLLHQAKAEAEVDTGGEAVSAHWAHLPNSVPSDPLGVEVLVHVQGQGQGYRVWVDVQKMRVVRKEPITPNPASKVR
jgi:hypothetical protein